MAAPTSGVGKSISFQKKKKKKMKSRPLVQEEKASSSLSDIGLYTYLEVASFNTESTSTTSTILVESSSSVLTSVAAVFSSN